MEININEKCNVTEISHIHEIRQFHGNKFKLELIVSCTAKEMWPKMNEIFSEEICKA